MALHKCGKLFTKSVVHSTCWKPKRKHSSRHKVKDQRWPSKVIFMRTKPKQTISIQEDLHVMLFAQSSDVFPYELQIVVEMAILRRGWKCKKERMGHMWKSSIIKNNAKTQGEPNTHKTKWKPIKQSILVSMRLRDWKGKEWGIPWNNSNGVSTHVIVWPLSPSCLPKRNHKMRQKSPLKLPLIT